MRAYKNLCVYYVEYGILLFLGLRDTVRRPKKTVRDAVCRVGRFRQQCCKLPRGSYMRAHVLLNLLNKFKKRNKIRGLSTILSLFQNKLNKFCNTEEQM